MADGDNCDSIIMEEEIDPNYVPGDDEVFEYAKWLGMDFDKDQDLFWIAREGLMAPLPKNWKPCKTKDTEDIYYFNFLTGESSWDHPCDGYYKRLYEEEKKKKEILIKESADEKKAKAKQDVELLLGKNDSKKSKKKKSNGLDDLGTSELTAPKSLNTLGPPVLGGIKGGKPLPGISNKLVNSLDSSIGGLAPLGGVSTSSSVPSLSKKVLSSPAVTLNNNTPTNNNNNNNNNNNSNNQLNKNKPLGTDQKSQPKKQTNNHQMNKMTDDGTDDDNDNNSSNSNDIKDSDSDSDESIQIEIKPVKVKQDSNSNSNKKKSKVGSRLKNVLSNSGDMTYSSPMPNSKNRDQEEKQGPNKNLFQSSDSDSIVRESNDSLGSFLPDQDANFQTPIKSKQMKKTQNNKQTYNITPNNNNNNNNRNDYDDNDDNYQDDNDDDDRNDEYEEKIKILQIDQTKLQNERKQFEIEKKQFETEKKQFDLEKKQFEANQTQFENDKKLLDIEKKNIQKLREKIEQERINTKEGTNNHFSPTKIKELSHQDLEYEEKYNKLLKEYEDIRREIISLQQEIEKGKKSLETEKNLRSANARESSERERNLKTELDTERGNYSTILNEKLALITEREQLSRKIIQLEQELSNKTTNTNNIISLSPSSSSTSTQYINQCPNHIETIERLENEIRGYKIKISNLEANQLESQQNEQSLRNKIQNLTQELNTSQSQFESLQADFRSKKRELEDSYDESAKYRREMETLRRQDADIQDELVRMRQGAQRAHELQFIIDSERQTYNRLKGDYDLVKTELDGLKLMNKLHSPSPFNTTTIPTPHLESKSLDNNNNSNNNNNNSNNNNNNSNNALLIEEIEAKKILIEQLKEQIEKQENNKRETIRQIENNHQGNIENLEKQYQKRVEEMKNLHRDEREKLENMNNEYLSKNRRLENELKEKSFDLESLEGKFQDQKLKYKELYEKNNELESELMNLKYKSKNELNENREKFQEELNKLNEDYQIILREKTKLQEERDRLQTKYNNMNVEINNKDNEIQQYREKLKETENGNLTIQQKQLEEKKTFQENIEIEMENKIRKLTLDIQKSDEKRKEYENLIDIKNDELLRLQHEIETLKSRDLQLQQQQKQILLEVEKKLETESYQQQRKDLQIKELEEECHELQRKLTEKQHEFMRNEEKQKYKGQESIGMFQNQISNLESAYEESIKAKEDALNSLLMIQNEKKKLKTDYDNLIFQSKILKQENESSLQRIETLEKEITNLHNEKNQLLASINKGNTDYNIMNSSNHLLKTELETIKQRVEILQKENQKYLDENRQLLISKSTNDHKVIELQHLLDTERARGLDIIERQPILNTVRSMDSLNSVDTISMGGGMIQSNSTGSGIGIGTIGLGATQLLQEIQTLRFTVQRTESELTKSQYSINDLKLINDDLRNQLSQSRIDLTQRTSERDQLKNEVNSLQRQITLKDEEIFQLKKNITTPAPIISSINEKIGTQYENHQGGKWTQIIAGQQEQISSLQTHRLEVEKTIAQQSNLVQKLELKLKEAEDAIQNHFETQKTTKSIKTSTAPQSPIQRKRNIEKEYNSKKYQPTPKPTTAKSRLRWDDGYNYNNNNNNNKNSYNNHNNNYLNSESSSGEKYYDDYEDETSRYGDLTYENTEVSDEDEEIIPLTYSKKYSTQKKNRQNYNMNMNNRWTTPSTNPSLQVVSILKDVLINLMNKESKDDLPISSKSKNRRYDDPQEWKIKLKKEKNTLQDIKKALKAENAYVQETAEQLSNQRNLWKEKKQNYQLNGGNKDMLRSEGVELNEQTNQLNELMKQVKKTQQWIYEREKKLYKWEKLMNERYYYDESDTPPASSNERDNITQHIEKMKRLELELDNDLTMLGSDLSPSRTSSRFSQNIGSTGASIPRSYSSTDHTSKHLPFPVHDYQSQTQPPPQIQTQIQPSSSQASIIPKYDRNGDGVNSIDYQNRLETRTHNVGKLVGEIDRENENNGVLKNRKSTQDPIRWFTDERKKTINVADDHVSWLDNLRREIGEFAHASQIPSSTTSTNNTNSGIMTRIQGIGIKDQNEEFSSRYQSDNNTAKNGNSQSNTKSTTTTNNNNNNNGKQAYRV